MRVDPRGSAAKREVSVVRGGDVPVRSWTGIMSAMTGRRMAVIAEAALCAVLLGGAAQTYVWRWGVEGLTKVSNSQFGWVLLCFVVAWAWARGRVSSGMVAGALTGLGLMGSYYCVQWFADGWARCGLAVHRHLRLRVDRRRHGWGRAGRRPRSTRGILGRAPANQEGAWPVHGGPGRGSRPSRVVLGQRRGAA